MKGVILAGGLGSRLMPITKVTNKHLMPVGDKPMIYHPIETLKTIGADEIILIAGPEHCGDFMKLLGDGSELGVDITYKVQMEPDGIAGALRLCSDFLRGEDFFPVILGDNIFDNSVCELVKKNTGLLSGSCYDGEIPQAWIILKEIEDASRFGVAEIAAINDEKPEEVLLSGIEEKPSVPKTNYAVTGLYVYDKYVFDVIDGLEKSDRGEYEITDVNNWYIKEGELRGLLFTDFWSDAGTFPSLYRTTKYLMGD